MQGKEHHAVSFSEVVVKCLIRELESLQFKVTWLVEINRVLVWHILVEEADLVIFEVDYPAVNFVRVQHINDLDATGLILLEHDVESARLPSAKIVFR